MNRFDTLPPHLRRLGEQLVAAAEQQQTSAARQHTSERTRRRPGWAAPTRRLAAGAAVAVVAVPGAAFAATQLLTTKQVAAGLVGSSQALTGTHPTCAVVMANVEYRCVLAKAPALSGAVQFSAMVERNGVVRIAIAENGVIETAHLATTKRHDLADFAEITRSLTRTKAHGAGTVTTTETTSLPAPATNWTGTTEVTVDATDHVNGACRSLNRAGTVWDCYTGRAAVDHGLIAAGMLGQRAPGHTVG